MGTWSDGRGWWGPHGIPAPQITAGAMCYEDSPPLEPSGLCQKCTRARGHTGRHAAYSPTEILARCGADG